MICVLYQEIAQTNIMKPTKFKKKLKFRHDKFLLRQQK